jgi:hypothetical protein
MAPANVSRGLIRLTHKHSRFQHNNSICLILLYLHSVCWGNVNSLFNFTIWYLLAISVYFHMLGCVHDLTWLDLTWERLRPFGGLFVVPV